jgi:hypothetical protein
MRLDQKLYEKESELWNKLFQDSKYFLANLFADKHQLYIKDNKNYNKFYPYSFWGSVIFGFLSFGILLYEYFIYLKNLV